MKWTSTQLKKVKIPVGKTKHSLSDCECNGLYFEVRKSTRVFIFRKMIDGKNYHKRLGTFPELTIFEARKLADECRRKAAIGTWHSYEKPNRLTMDDLFYEHYYPHSCLVHKTYKARRGSYRQHIQPTLGKKPVHEVSPRDIHIWRSGLLKLGLSAATINKLSILMGQLFDIAQKLDVANAPNRRNLGLKGLTVLNKNEFFLTSEQLSKIRNECSKSSNKNLLNIVDLLILTGARKREILDASWDCVDLDQQVLHVPCSKNGKPRQITLPQRAVDIFIELKKTSINEKYVLPNPSTGKPYGCFFHAWDKARKAAGLPKLRVHDLRHSFASALVNSGVSLYEVQTLLGHASIKTTQRYAHLDRKRLQKSVEHVFVYYGGKK